MKGWQYERGQGVTSDAGGEDADYSSPNEREA